MDKSATQWMIEPLKKYATFSGRARRKEFWWFWLLTYVAYTGASLMVAAVQLIAGRTFGLINLVPMIVWILLFLPTLGVVVRRLHDMAYSGWWLLLCGVASLPFCVFVPLAMLNYAPGEAAWSMQAVNGAFGLMVVAYIILLLVCCRRGTIGENRFGPDPISE